MTLRWASHRSTTWPLFSMRKPKSSAPQQLTQAARLVLQQGLEVSALICQRFQAEMAAVIRKSIPGVRVTKIQTPGFQPKRFPEVDEVGLRGFPARRSLSSLNR